MSKKKLNFEFSAKLEVETIVELIKQAAEEMTSRKVKEVVFHTEKKYNDYNNRFDDGVAEFSGCTVYFEKE
jgi:hypothetical protein